MSASSPSVHSPAIDRANTDSLLKYFNPPPTEEVPKPPAPIPPAAARPPAKRGRPVELDATRKREICALVSAGAGLVGAAKYVGCAERSIRRAARRDADFGQLLRNALLFAELEPLRAIRAAGTQNWRAHAWLLDRATKQQSAADRSPRKSPPIDPEAEANALADEIVADLSFMANDDAVTELLDLQIRQTTRRHLVKLAAKFAAAA